MNRVVKRDGQEKTHDLELEGPVVVIVDRIGKKQHRAGEVDRFLWFCPNCDAPLHEETAEVRDYRADPVSKAYARFFDSEEFRTCKKCKHVMPKP